MSTKKFLFGGRFLTLSLILIMVATSLAFAQNDDAITQKDFALMLFRAKQLDARFTKTPGFYSSSVQDYQTKTMGLDTRFTRADTVMEKIHLLEKLGLAPDGGYIIDESLTLGVLSMVLVKALKMENLLNDNPQAKDYVKLLANEGIVSGTDPAKTVTMQEVEDAFSKASIPVTATDLPDFQKPLSAIE